MSNLFKVFEIFGKQTILDYARSGGCEYVRLNLETKKPDKRARKLDKLQTGADKRHIFLQVDYDNKAFMLKSM